MRRIVIALVALLVMAVAAPAAGAQTTNFVRLMHNSPDAPAVDIFVNGQAVAQNVPFFTTSGYLPLPDGTYEVAIAPAGRGTDYSVFVGSLTVQGGVTTTVAAMNFLERFEVVAFTDNNGPVAAGKARVRIIHGSPNAPAVDVKLAGTSTTVLAGAAYKDAAYLEVDAGTYRFDIAPAGSSTVVFTTPALRFEPGWVYTLVASGDLTKNFWVQSRVDRAGP